MKNNNLNPATTTNTPSAFASTLLERKSSWRILPVCLSAVLFLAGCSAMQTPYERPNIQTPQQWGYSTQTQGQSMLQSNDRWWTLFEDKQLSALVALAFERNPDLAAAALKVRQAQLEARLSESDRIPDVSLGASGSQRRGIEHKESWNKSSSASFSVSYEIDLWEIGRAHV